MQSQGGAATPTGLTVWQGPRNSRHRLLVVADPSTTGRMIGQEQKRTLMTFFDFIDVTLSFKDKIKYYVLKDLKPISFWSRIIFRVFLIKQSSILGFIRLPTSIICLSPMSMFAIIIRVLIINISNTVHSK